MFVEEDSSSGFVEFLSLDVVIVDERTVIGCDDTLIRCSFDDGQCLGAKPFLAISIATLCASNQMCSLELGTLDHDEEIFRGETAKEHE